MKLLLSDRYFIPVPKKYKDIFYQHQIKYDTLEVKEKCFESDLIPIIQNYDGVIAGDDQYTSMYLQKHQN